jgi:hypothetical protein
VKTAISEGGLERLERLEKARREVRRAVRSRLAEIAFLVRTSLGLKAPRDMDARKTMISAATLFQQMFIAAAQEIYKGKEGEKLSGIALDTFHQLLGHDGTYTLCEKCRKIGLEIGQIENFKEDGYHV